MKRFWLFFLLLNFANLWAQTQIIGRVVDADSHAVAAATVRLWGLTSQPANAQGYFQITLSQQTAKAHALAPGRDLYIEVEKEGMVVLEPPDKKFRLPDNPETQAHFRVVMVKKGSPLLARSERMLEYVFQKRLTAAIAANDKEAARQLELAQEAARLGLPEEKLRVAVENYKESLRTSPDLNKRGLALLDDANAETESKIKQQKLDQAEGAFREASRKNLLAIREGRKAEALQPEIDFNLGQTFFAKARYDSAAIYFAKADSAAPGDADKLNMLGRALDELAQYDKAMQVYQRAFAKDTTTFGRNHPKVAIRLNNIAGVLESKGDYAGALEKYNEALNASFAYFKGAILN